MSVRTPRLAPLPKKCMFFTSPPNARLIFCSHATLSQELLYHRPALHATLIIPREIKHLCVGAEACRFRFLLSTTYNTEASGFKVDTLSVRTPRLAPLPKKCMFFTSPPNARLILCSHATLSKELIYHRPALHATLSISREINHLCVGAEACRFKFLLSTTYNTEASGF